MFGSHLSIAGGLHNALLAASALGCDTVQIFTKNQQQWRVPPLEKEASESWRQHLRRLKYKHTVSHASYLINLASADPDLWRKSVDLFDEELARCEALGIPYLVTHPGSHCGSGEEAGLGRVITALDELAARRPRGQTIICLEITAGQGSCLGDKLEHLAHIIDKVKKPGRLGVCLDTAHLFAAGHDFRGRHYARLMRKVESTVGLERVKVLHLNDSKKPLGSRVDRHEHIGRGTIGRDGFAPWVRDSRFAAVPKILETPKGTDPETGQEWDRINLDVLKGMM